MASSTAHPATPGFVVEQVHPPQLLVLHSNSLVPAAWRARLGGLIDFSWTWTFAWPTLRGGHPPAADPGHGQGHGGWGAPTSPRSSRPTTWPTACWQASAAEQIATTTPD